MKLPMICPGCEHLSDLALGGLCVACYTEREKIKHEAMTLAERIEELENKIAHLQEIFLSQRNQT